MPASASWPIVINAPLSIVVTIVAYVDIDVKPVFRYEESLSGNVAHVELAPGITTCF